MNKETTTIYSCPSIRVHIGPSNPSIRCCDYSANEIVEIEDIGFDELNRSILYYVRNLGLQKDEGYKIKWLKELEAEVQTSIEAITANTDTN